MSLEHLQEFLKFTLDLDFFYKIEKNLLSNNTLSQLPIFLHLGKSIQSRKNMRAYGSGNLVVEGREKNMKYEMVLDVNVQERKKVREWLG